MIKQKKVGVDTKDLKRGKQIVYVPLHAGDNINHKDAEPGFVSSVKRGIVYCRYWSKREQEELRTKINSEVTDPDRIVIKRTVPQKLVKQMLEKYC